MPIHRKYDPNKAHKKLSNVFVFLYMCWS